MRAAAVRGCSTLLLASSTNLVVHGFVPRSPSINTSAQPPKAPAATGTACFSSLGSMFGSMVAGMLKGPAPAPTDMAAFQDPAPSWAALEKLLAELQTPEERALPELRAQGRGPPSSKAALRLFDAPDGYEPRVILYRDTAAWCPYCEKVWLYLEEKRIPYKVSKVPMRCYGQKPAWFSRLSATGLLPVMELDGEVVIESDVIIQTLEDRFPDAVPLLPLAKDPNAGMVSPLLRLERELFSAWLRWLTGSTTTNDRSKLAFENVLGRVESALGESGGPYFLGETFSLIDCIFAPFMERMAATLCFYKGFVMRDHPQYKNVERWFRAMEGRESFLNIKSDWFTHAMDMPPQVGSCSMVTEAEPFANEIAGKDGSWTLPLKVNGVEPVMAHREDGAAKREAAAQLISNHAAVVAFAARALGEPGVPPVMASLADPNAKPNEAYLPLLDAALRAVAQGLLQGYETLPAPTGFVAGEAVAQGLEYLRERVGVPRDMSYEAARQFRGQLGWYAAQLREKAAS